jgi:hypothetical protein
LSSLILINYPLNQQLFRLKCAWFGKAHYKEEVAENRKELESPKKKIKKKEAEILKKKIKKTEAEIRKWAAKVGKQQEKKVC